MESNQIDGTPVSILLVEDNDAHAELIKRSLVDNRVLHNIYHLRDGEAALDYLFRSAKYKDPNESPRPDVILLDLRLPKISGLEVLKEIKTTDIVKKIPVVILTSSWAKNDVDEAYNHYANSYIVKPVDFLKFSQLMEDLGFYWSYWNHKPVSKRMNLDCK